MKKKTLYNIKGAGRPAIHDRGIRHIARDKIKRLTALHLTVKMTREKAGIRNKFVLKALHRAILKARVKGLSILHYTLEYDHVHLMVEVDSNTSLGNGMQAFGICFSKQINKMKNSKGQVYKTRYHFRKLKTPNEIKNALHYIFANGMKHKKCSAILSLYNSLPHIKNFRSLYAGFEFALTDTMAKNILLNQLHLELDQVLAHPRLGLIRKFIT